MKLLFKRIIVAITITTMIVTGVTPYAYGSEENKIEKTVQGMSLKEKICQMMMVDFRKWDGKDFIYINDEVAQIVEDYNFGAVLFFAENLKSTEQSYNLSKELQKAAIKDNGIPLMICADQEGGRVYRLGSGTAMPGNMATAASGNAKNAQIVGKIIGDELNAIGINTNLAPVLDVNNNANNPVIDLRSFSDDAETVGEYGVEMIRGFNEANIIACAKHFPGHGDTAVDSHYGLPIVNKSKEDLIKTELKPFQKAIDSGVDMIMTAHILYPQIDKDFPATMSEKILTGILKRDMGFDGIVCTDSMGMAGVTANWTKAEACINAINAGVDMLCAPVSLRNQSSVDELDVLISDIEKAVLNGDINQTRIDDAVTKILKTKEEKGLLDYNVPIKTLEEAKAIVGSSEHKIAERKIAVEGVTVVKNDENLLPINVTDNSKILVICPPVSTSSISHETNLTAQIAIGWNRAKDKGLVPNKAQIECYEMKSSDNIEILKEKVQWADHIILLSQLEDIKGMTFNDWRTARMKELVDFAATKNIKSVVMSIDNPYDVQLYKNADAIIAVYNFRGSNADAKEILNNGNLYIDNASGPNVAAGIEVVLGVSGASGRLPLDIPRFNQSNKIYEEVNVYSRGWGLSYKAKEVTKDEIKDEADKEEADQETDIEKTEQIIKSITDVKMQYSLYTYNGYSKKPGITVYAGDEVLCNNATKSNDKVKITYDSGRKVPGTYTVTVEGIGKYTGKISKKFTIRVGQVAITSLSKGTNYFTTKWNTKTSSYVTGYQIRYSKTSDMKSYATKTIKSSSIGSIKVTGLQNGQKYFVKVRAYKNINGKTYYSVWSSPKSVKLVTVKLTKPSNVIVKRNSNNKPYVKWNGVTGAKGYSVYAKTTSSGTYTKVGYTTNKYFTYKNAKKGKTYYIAVRAIHKADSAGNSYLSSRDSVWTIDPNKKMIALTFDDGPGPYTQDIVKQLDNYNATATFYVVGNRVASYKSQLKSAYIHGNEIGNHSWSHPMLTSLSYSGVQSQMSRTDNAVKNVIGVKPKTMRPPGGAYNDTVRSAVGRPLIYWSVDTLDWKTRSKSATIKSVMDNASDGEIVLMHDIHYPTMQAALEIIPRLKAKGYQMVTVSELAKYRNSGMKKGKVYFEF